MLIQSREWITGANPGEGHLLIALDGDGLTGHTTVFPECGLGGPTCGGRGNLFGQDVEWLALIQGWKGVHLSLKDSSGVEITDTQLTGFMYDVIDQIAGVAESSAKLAAESILCLAAMSSGQSSSDSDALDQAAAHATAVAELEDDEVIAWRSLRQAGLDASQAVRALLLASGQA